MHKHSSPAVLLLVLALMAPLALAACGKTVNRTIDDATISTRVKTALLNDPAVGARPIDVTTFGGVVTLSGTVRTAVERDRAVSVAHRINGVSDVKSTLQIQPQNP
jgi:hyperosmotically inducible protein